MAFTGVACMPNTKPVTDNAEVVDYILKKLRKQGSEFILLAVLLKECKAKELTDFAELKNAGCVAISDDGRPVENAELSVRHWNSQVILT